MGYATNILVFCFILALVAYLGGVGTEEGAPIYTINSTYYDLSDSLSAFTTTTSTGGVSALFATVNIGVTAFLGIGSMLATLVTFPFTAFSLLDLPYNLAMGIGTLLGILVIWGVFTWIKTGVDTP